MDPVEWMTNQFPMMSFANTIEEFEKFPRDKQSVELFCATLQYRGLTHALDYFQRDAGRLLDENSWRFHGEAQAFARKRFDAELFALTGLKQATWRDQLHPLLPKRPGLQPAHSGN